MKTGSGKMFRDKLISNEKIKKGKRIGNGQFGEVYKGNGFIKRTKILMYKKRKLSILIK